MSLGVPLTVMGLGFMALSGLIIFGLVRTWHRQRTWEPWEATVEELEVKTSNAGEDSNTRVVAHYRYRDRNGQEHQGSDTLKDRRIGFDDEDRKVDIVVDPADPSRSMVAKPTGGAVGCFLVFCIPFLVVGVLMFLGGVGMLLG